MFEISSLAFLKETPPAIQYSGQTKWTKYQLFTEVEVASGDNLPSRELYTKTVR